MIPRAIVISLIAVYVTSLSGCRALRGESAQCAESGASERLARRHADIYAQAAESFGKAILLKPEYVEDRDVDDELAPLIVHEVDGGNGQPGMRFGALRQDEDGRIFADTDYPTVYFSDENVTIAGAVRTMMTYQWYYDCGEASKPRVAMKGIRSVVGPDGFVQVWEVLDEPGRDWRRNTVRVFFVARSFEAAAVKRFGGPLPGRRYAIERSAADAPEAVVAGIVEDGPIPMGPYVYLDAPGRRITTLLCRCSPAKMQSVAKTGYYDLVAAVHVEHLTSGDSSNQTSGGQAEGMGPSGRRPLEEVLRWPGVEVWGGHK